MTDRVIGIVLETISTLRHGRNFALSVDSANHVTLRSLDLDSLNTLRLAMELEEALGVDIEIVDFPEDMTISDLARRLSNAVVERSRNPHANQAQL